MSAKGGRLHGLSALVTGAGGGIGRAIARQLAREGARVALVDRDESAVATAANDIEAAGGIVRAVAFDLAERDTIPEMVDEAARQAGGLDIVVNNAGISQFIRLDDPAYLAVWDCHFAILLDAPMAIARAALPHLRRSPSARILNIASTEGLGATAGGSAYSAAKSGVIGLTRSLAVEFGKENITVNCICPGPIETGMTAGIAGDEKAVFARRRTALRRYGLPEEVAEIAVSFCTPGASYLTGAIVPVDGGLMARNG